MCGPAPLSSACTRPAGAGHPQPPAVAADVHSWRFSVCVLRVPCIVAGDGLLLDQGGRRLAGRRCEPVGSAAAAVGLHGCETAQGACSRMDWMCADTACSLPTHLWLCNCAGRRSSWARRGSQLTWRRMGSSCCIHVSRLLPTTQLLARFVRWLLAWFVRQLLARFVRQLLPGL